MADDIFMGKHLIPPNPAKGIHTRPVLCSHALQEASPPILLHQPIARPFTAPHFHSRISGISLPYATI
jgi:hypothetical protein